MPESGSEAQGAGNPATNLSTARQVSKRYWFDYSRGGDYRFVIDAAGLTLETQYAVAEHPGCEPSCAQRRRVTVTRLISR